MQQGVKFTEVWNIVQVKYIFWLDAISSCEAQIKLIEMVQTTPPPPPSLWEKADPPFFANISKTNHPSPPLPLIKEVVVVVGGGSIQLLCNKADIGSLSWIFHV